MANKNSNICPLILKLRLAVSKLRFILFTGACACVCVWASFRNNTQLSLVGSKAEL